MCDNAHQKYGPSLGARISYCFSRDGRHLGMHIIRNFAAFAAIIGLSLTIDRIYTLQKLSENSADILRQNDSILRIVVRIGSRVDDIPKDTARAALGKFKEEKPKSLTAKDTVSMNALFKKPSQWNPYTVNDSAQRLMESRKYSEAAPLFRRLIDSLPHVLSFRLDLGSSYLRQGLLDSALNVWERALSVDTDDAVVPYSMGVVYSRLQQLKKAQEYFQMAAKRNTALCDAYYNLALIDIANGDYKNASDMFLKAILCDPANIKRFQKLLPNYTQQHIRTSP